MIYLSYCQFKLRVCEEMCGVAQHCAGKTDEGLSVQSMSPDSSCCSKIWGVAKSNLHFWHNQDSKRMRSTGVMS